MQNEYDLVIVGAGIGGAALATRLSRAGTSVLLLERTLEHVDRIRGEWLAPWGLQHAINIGVLPELLKAGGHYVPRFVKYGETVSIETARTAPLSSAELIPGIPGVMMIGHPAACNVLDEAAEAAGAHLLRGVQDIVVTPGHPPTISFTLNGETQSLRPRLIVGADGRSSTVARQIGAKHHAEPVHHLIGGLLLDDVADWPEDEQTLGVHGDNYLLVFPQGNGRLRLYLCCSPSAAHNFRGAEAARNFLNAFAVPNLPHSNAIAAGRIAGPCLGYPNANVTVERPFADGIVLIGDAAGHTDPTIGQGLSITFADVQMFSDILLADTTWSDFSAYVTERNERMRRLRIVASVYSKLQCEWGEDARAFRANVEDRLARDPQLGNIRHVPLVGPYRFEDGTCGDIGVRRIFGDHWSVTEAGTLRMAA